MLHVHYRVLGFDVWLAGANISMNLINFCVCLFVFFFNVLHASLRLLYLITAVGIPRTCSIGNHSYVGRLKNMDF